MATVTPNLGLTLPIGSEKVSRSIINGNMSIIDTFCGDINKSTLRDVPFAIAVNDWVSSNGQWVANFTTAYVTATSKEIGYYNKSIVDYAKAHILMEKKSGGGGLVFTTAKKPTGLIEGTVLVFDNDDLKLPVLIEDTVVSIANGGTGANTLAGAKNNLGITALSDQIANVTGFIKAFTNTGKTTLTIATKQTINAKSVFLVAYKNSAQRLTLVSGNGVCANIVGSDCTASVSGNAITLTDNEFYYGQVIVIGSADFTLS